MRSHNKIYFKYKIGLALCTGIRQYLIFYSATPSEYKFTIVYRSRETPPEKLLRSNTTIVFVTFPGKYKQFFCSPLRRGFKHKTPHSSIQNTANSAAFLLKVRGGGGDVSPKMNCYFSQNERSFFSE